MALLLPVPPAPDNRGMTSAVPRVCAHVPACPSAEALDHDAAHVLSAHPEQGWSLLCNGVITFEDLGELSPGGVLTGSPRAAMRTLYPHRLSKPRPFDGAP